VTQYPNSERPAVNIGIGAIRTWPHLTPYLYPRLLTLTHGLAPFRWTNLRAGGLSGPFGGASRAPRVLGPLRRRIPRSVLIEEDEPAPLMLAMKFGVFCAAD